MTSTNYSNRTVDLEFLQTAVNVAALNKLNMSLFTPTRVVTGIQKLVQRYFIIFLSMKDFKYDSEFGTDFVFNVINGSIVSNSDVASLFAISNDAVISMLNKETPAAHLDEIIDNVVLEDYSISFAESKLYLKLLITSKAGTNATFILPTTIPR